LLDEIKNSYEVIEFFKKKLEDKENELENEKSNYENHTQENQLLKQQLASSNEQWKTQLASSHKKISIFYCLCGISGGVNVCFLLSISGFFQKLKKILKKRKIVAKIRTALAKSPYFFPKRK
jgi:hypothetical protein